MTEAHISLGIAAIVGPEVVAAIAPAVEEAGFHTLWINDNPRGDSLEVAAAATSVTKRLAVGTGVIPIDRRSASSIADDVERFGIDPQRLTLGIGSGGSRVGALDRVRGAIDELRERLPSPIVVGALGPKMRRLAAEHGDGVVLNWLPVSEAEQQAREHHEIDPDGRVVLYVRTIAEESARAKLRSEVERYSGVWTYAAHFKRLGFDPMDTVLPAGDDATIDRGLAAFRGAVDEVVLRTVTSADDADTFLRYIETVRPA